MEAAATAQARQDVVVTLFFYIYISNTRRSSRCRPAPRNNIIIMLKAADNNDNDNGGASSSSKKNTNISALAKLAAAKPLRRQRNASLVLHKIQSLAHFKRSDIQLLNSRAVDSGNSCRNIKSAVPFRYTELISANKLIAQSIYRGIWRRQQQTGEEGSSDNKKEKTVIIKQLSKKKTLATIHGVPFEYLAMVHLGSSDLIAKVYDMYEDPFNFYIVMRHYGRGSLQQFIETDANYPMSQNRFVAYAVRILKALHHCHENGFSHQDLKPDNVLLKDNNNGSSGCDIVLTDFGACQIEGLKSINNSSSSSSTTTSYPKWRGSFSYAAPEKWRLLDDDDFLVDGTKCDMWSFGVLMYALLFRRLPFCSNNIFELRRSILFDDAVFDEQQHGLQETRCRRDSKCDPLRIMLLIRMLLMKIPENRPGYHLTLAILNECWTFQ